MTKTKNAAGSHTPAASENSTFTQDYNINPEKSKGEIQRIPIQRLPDNIPSSLKQLNQWCLAGNDKIPLNTVGDRIDVTNPDNFVSFQTVLAASSKLTCAVGVGFILSPSDNIVVVDVDRCVNKSGEFSDVAKDILELLPTYAEFSQSKTGLHLIYQDDDIPAGFTGKKGVVEVYSSKRYVALTGWKLPSTPADVTCLNGLTKRLLDNYFPNTGYTSSTDILEQHSYHPVQSNDVVLQSLQSNQKFRRLFYDGDISGYPSQSEADGALMLLLATATALNATQMRELFTQSALGKRDKWVNRRWYQDYLIAGAIRFVGKENNEMDNWNSFFDGVFYDQIQHYSKYAQRKTGFNNLDVAHKFFAPGLYVLSGVSGVGKTTFAWQLCEQLARRGEHIIYVSYEMSSLDLFAKSVSRKLREKIIAGTLPANAMLSSTDIKSGLINKNVQNVVDELKQITLSVNIYNATGNDTVENIITKISNQLPSLSKSPVVVIDYLQIIPHKDATVKQNIDKVVTQLKNFQRDTNTTFIVISSINRAFYGKPLTFEALKESGGIEYSADVIWGLQIHQQYDAREIRLTALKNRMGDTYSVTFDYYPDSDLFVPKFDLEQKGIKIGEKQCKR